MNVILYPVGSCIFGFSTCIDVGGCRFSADPWLAGTEMSTGFWVGAGGHLQPFISLSVVNS